MNYALAGIVLTMLAAVMATTLDSVGEYQLNAVWNCGWEYTEIEHQRWCRNELDGFGSLYDGGQQLIK